MFIVYSFVICLSGQLLVHFVPFCPAHLLIDILCVISEQINDDDDDDDDKLIY